jgi:hypothetical protein
MLPVTAAVFNWPHRVSTAAVGSSVLGMCAVHLCVAVSASVCRPQLIGVFAVTAGCFHHCNAEQPLLQQPCTALGVLLCALCLAAA